jgi:hypothetical protein
MMSKASIQVMIKARVMSFSVVRSFLGVPSCGASVFMWDVRVVEQ